MARPTREQQQINDCLAEIEALLSDVWFLSEVLRVRLRQVQRRATGNGPLARAVGPAMSQLDELRGEVGQAQQVTRHAFAAMDAMLKRANVKRRRE